MSELRQQKILQKINMKSYLANLGVLVGRTVKPEELGSIEYAAELRRCLKRDSDKYPYTTVCEIPFADRNSERFRQFIKKLHDANPSPVYIWLSETIFCGTFLVPSLEVINFNFDMSLNGGIVSFRASPSNDGLSLDSFDESNGEVYMEIQTCGEHWENIPY